MFYFINCSFMVLWLVGIVLSVFRWKQSPRTFMLTIIGLFGMLIASANEIARNYLYTLSPSDVRLNPTLFFNIQRATLFGQAGFEFIGWILILLAIFSSVKKRSVSES